MSGCGCCTLGLVYRLSVGSRKVLVWPEEPFCCLSASRKINFTPAQQSGDQKRCLFIVPGWLPTRRRKTHFLVEKEQRCSEEIRRVGQRQAGYVSFWFRARVYRLPTSPPPPTKRASSCLVPDMHRHVSGARHEIARFSLFGMNMSLSSFFAGFLRACFGAQ